MSGSSSSTSARQAYGHSQEGSEELKQRSHFPRSANASYESPPVSRPNSPRPSHHHLGLRPKASDSLHTRLRTSNPAPKHVSKIEDVMGSRRPSYLGSSREGSVEPKKEGGSKIQSNQASDGDASAGVPENQGYGPGEEIEYIEEITTDIGIYDEAIYDVYLGPLMGCIRRQLIKSLRWESPFLARHQAYVRNSRLDRYFVYTSLLGSHSFFLIFLPTSFWLGNARFARGLVNVLAFGVYLSSAVKDALCIPRPYSPPVTRLVIGTTHLEYGFLSTHSTNALSVALYVYLWLRALRQEMSIPSVLQTWLCEVVLLYYVISVVYGRIYAGMHSIMDCVMGCALGAIITLVQWSCFDIIELATANTGWTVPLIVNSVGLLAVIAHPQPLDDCPCFEDAIAFLSVVMGVVTGRWLNVRYGLLPLNDNILRGTGNSHHPSAAPLLDTLQSKAFAMLENKSDDLASRILSITFAVSTKVLTVILGVTAILLTRIVVKTVCRVILPPIFHFAQGSLGLILPRRHYKTTTEIAAAAAKDAVGRPTHKKQLSSVTAGEFFSHKSDPKEYDSEHWTVDNRSISQQTQDLAQSGGQTRPARAERSKVKFTLGDGSDIPVPFTHPNTHLPGDAFSERIAGALSADEKQRQERETENGFQFPTRQDEMVAGGTGAATAVTELDVAQHYDVDVLTKVFVYFAIGLVTGSPLPVAFKSVGL